MTHSDAALAPPAVALIDLALPLEVAPLPAFDRPLNVHVRAVPLLTNAPWVRTLGKLAMEVTTQGWRFPTPGEPAASLKVFQPKSDAPQPDEPSSPPMQGSAPPAAKQRTRLQPPGDMVLFKDRLLYLLQPALEDIFAGKHVRLPFPPYPYQVKGIAFLMPRHAAL